MTLLALILGPLAACALFALGYREGVRHDRRRIARLAEEYDAIWDAETMPDVRPQFVAPVIDIEAMQRIERAVMPRLKKINCSTRGDA